MRHINLFLGAPFGRLIFIHLQCWEVPPFLTIQGQRCIKMLCPKDPEFYIPLALNCQKGRHLPALEVYQKQSPTNRACWVGGKKFILKRFTCAFSVPTLRCCCSKHASQTNRCSLSPEAAREGNGMMCEALCVCIQQECCGLVPSF